MDEAEKCRACGWRVPEPGGRNIEAVPLGTDRMRCILLGECSDDRMPGIMGARCRIVPAHGVPVTRSGFGTGQMSADL